MKSIEQRIAEELGVRAQQVEAAVALLDGGSTVPFIARYRKEATGTLDDTQLRTLDERLRYLRELEERRKAILEASRRRASLTTRSRADLGRGQQGAPGGYLSSVQTQAAHQGADRHESRAGAARRALLSKPEQDPKAQAAPVRRRREECRGRRGGAGGRARHSGGALRRGRGSDRRVARGVLVAGRSKSKVREGKKLAEGAKFSDYFDFSEPLTKLPVASYSGGVSRREGGVSRSRNSSPRTRRRRRQRAWLYESASRGPFGIADRGRPGDRWLGETVRWAWRTKIELHLGVDLRARLWQAAEEEASTSSPAICATLLLAAPAGARATLGLDPGFRTGVKVAVVDATGKFVATTAIYPHEPQQHWDEALATSGQAGARAQGRADRDRQRHGLARDRQTRRRIDRHRSRTETDQDRGVGGRRLGLFGFAHSPRAELPDLDVSLRGAVSIARRLQDPLAELVKIDPKSIGVGQYQHDVTEIEAIALARRRGGGLRQRGRRRCQHGLGAAARARFRHRRIAGRATSSRIATPRAVPQPRRAEGSAAARAEGLRASAGFLRILDGDDPLDASARASRSLSLGAEDSSRRPRTTSSR